MNNRHLLSRGPEVFVIVLVAVFGSNSISANRGPENFQGPRHVDVSKNNHAIVAPNDPEATYKGARVVHNVTVNGQKGMRIHANFTVKYGFKVPCMLIAYFHFDDRNGKPLRTDQTKYRAKDGSVVGQVSFTPAHDPAVYED